ncbi:MAG: hypothetical protein ACQESJ_11465 [Bacteroidota bacterium]
MAGPEKFSILIQAFYSNKATPSKEIKTWLSIRSPEILILFKEEIYGRIPGELKISSYKILEESHRIVNKFRSSNY